MVAMAEQGVGRLFASRYETAVLPRVLAWPIFFRSSHLDSQRRSADGAARRISARERVEALYEPVSQLGGGYL